jgi:uncharacterized membrane protein
MKIRKREKRATGAVYLLAYISGTALFVLSHWVRVNTAVGPEHHPVEQWVRILHATATYFLVMALGFLLKGHVMPGLKGKRRIPSGLVVFALGLIMIGTALGVMYSGESEGPRLIAWIHSLLGLSTIGFILFHKKKTVPIPT